MAYLETAPPNHAAGNNLFLRVGFEIRNDLAPLVLAFHVEGHVITGDEFLRVGEPFVQRVVSPLEFGLPKRSRVLKRRDRRGPTAINAERRGPSLSRSRAWHPLHRFSNISLPLLPDVGACPEMGKIEPPASTTVAARPAQKRWDLRRSVNLLWSISICTSLRRRSECRINHGQAVFV